jgi:hypothetical protein
MSTEDVNANKMILYDSVSTTEAENLSKACTKTITGEEKGGAGTTITNFLKEVCFCGGTFTTDRSLNESVFSVLSFLEKNALHAEGMFMRPVADKHVKQYCDLISLDEEINYKDADPIPIAAGFKMYAEENIKDIIPANVARALIRAYEDNDKEAKRRIVPRIPFVLNEIQRLFLKALLKLFNALRASQHTKDANIKDVYTIFAPIVIRRPDDMLGTTTFTLRSAFADIMGANFDEFPMSFYSAPGK